MAIPNRTTLTCPQCGASQNVTIGDSSIGPRGRISDTPIYSMTTQDLWTQTKRNGETFVSCVTCGEVEFITLASLARNPTW